MKSFSMEKKGSENAEDSAGLLNNTNASLSKLFMLAASILAVAIVILGITSNTLYLANQGDLCSSDSDYSSHYGTRYYSSVNVPKQSCNPTCSDRTEVNIVNKANVSMSLFSNMFGGFYEVPDTLTGNTTLMSMHQGPINMAQSLLCDFTAATNSTATIFQFLPPYDFERIVTTLPEVGGVLAACTYLSKTNPAYNHLLNGNTYRGQVNLYGNTYQAIYEPIFDVRTSSLIGAIYVGVPVF